MGAFSLHGSSGPSQSPAAGCRILSAPEPLLGPVTQPSRWQHGPLSVPWVVSLPGAASGQCLTNLEPQRPRSLPATGTLGRAITAPGIPAGTSAARSLQVSLCLCPVLASCFLASGPSQGTPRKPACSPPAQHPLSRNPIKSTCHRQSPVLALNETPSKSPILHTAYRLSPDPRPIPNLGSILIPNPGPRLSPDSGPGLSPGIHGKQRTT